MCILLSFALFYETDVLKIYNLKSLQIFLDIKHNIILPRWEGPQNLFTTQKGKSQGVTVLTITYAAIQFLR